MTIEEAIQTVDEQKPNAYTREEKLRWLTTLDETVKTELIDTHEDNKEYNASGFQGYNEDTPEDTKLLVHAPYDALYLRYLEMQIDYANGEIGKYNNSAALYNAAYETFARFYNRKYFVKAQNKLRFF